MSPLQDVVTARPREGAARHRVHEPRLLGAPRIIPLARKRFSGAELLLQHKTTKLDPLKVA